MSMIEHVKVSREDGKRVEVNKGSMAIVEHEQQTMNSRYSMYIPKHLLS